MKAIRTPFLAKPPGRRSGSTLLALFVFLTINAPLRAQQIALDFGDAPKPYPTLMNEGGASHAPLKGFNLGSLIDTEPDGQPSNLATGDDASPPGAPPDEDGVQFNTNPLIPGQFANVTVILSAGQNQGRIDAWIDFNRDGDWADQGEQIFISSTIAGGATMLRFPVPADAVPGPTFARFRLSREGGLKFGDFAPDGEVEDHAIAVQGEQIVRDFGDAPAPYPTTLKDDGARHRTLKGFQLGERIDVEADGQPDSDAVGDDKNPANSPGSDEDGVILNTNPLLAGKEALIEFILIGQQGRMDAWVDFNQDGDWADEGEQIFKSEPLAGGANPNSFIVPSGAKEGLTFARFRLSREGSLTPVGEAVDGEVEDYVVRIQTPQEFFDFGDAPAPYPTLLTANGARHTAQQGFFLGKVIDIEANGNPNSDATGDDIAGSANIGDDEDGVQFPTAPLIGGTSSQVEVTLSSGRGAIDAWIDFNRDGDWADAGEQIATAQSILAGPNNISFSVPAGTVAGVSFARFRLSIQGGLGVTGPSSAGEVEDYQVSLEKAASTFDFGDAPAPYPTLLANNGPRHPFREGFFLGAAYDQETNGQPNADATGDDAVIAGAAARDDEDGVKFLTGALTGGTTTRIEVTVTGVRGMLDAWIDFNRDGDWADAGEQIAAAQLMNTGVNTLNVSVPNTTVAGLSFARFRLSAQGGLGVTGLASDGEVEDYQVPLEKMVEVLDFADAPAPYPTTLKDNGARHALKQRFVLGQLMDLELDGQPTSGATGDDLNNPGPVGSDEDGVKFLTAPLVPTQTAKIEVSLLSGPGRLDAWIDFNRDGDWADAGEQIFNSQALVVGVNTLDVKIPENAVAGESYARFRLSSQGGLSFTGLAGDGEVEDYLVRIGTKPPTTVDLVINKTGEPNPVMQGDILTYALTVVNSGQTTATGVTVTDQINSSATVIDAVAQPGSCTVSGGGLVSCSIGTLAPQATAKVTIRVRPNVTGFISNTGVVTSTEPEATPQNNSSTVRTSVGGGDQVPCDPRTNRGTDFWLTFPGNYAPDLDNPIKLSIAIIGQRLTTGTVEIPGLGFSMNFTIPASQEVIIPLPSAADLAAAIDLVENKGINVRASAEVAVFGLNRVLFTTDGYLGLPSDVVGKAYLIQAYKNVHEGVPELNGTQFAVVANQDDTRVAIRPSVTIGARAAGVAYIITLNKGQTYQLRSTNDAPADLSGSIVLADKPISVFAGHQVANVASKDMFFGDYLVEQLVSFERAGTRFMSMPLATRLGGDTFRFAAFQNGTTVSVNGVAIGTLNAGQIIERIIAGPSLILADKPIQVTQFANSSDFDGRINADPFMIVLPHQGQYLNRVPIWTPAAGFGSHHINVVAPTAVVGAVTLDGVAIPAASFVVIPGSGYSGAQVVVTPGAHTVQANVPIGVTCYGWAEFDSYGFPGGMFFGDTQPPQLVCPESPIVVKLGTSSTSPCTTTIPDLRQMVQVTDNCQMPERIVINQEPKPGTVVGPGTYQIVLSTSDANGNIGFCIVEFKVIDETPVILSCPQDMLVNCQTEQGAKVNFRVVAKGRCDDNYEVISTPASGSFFPIGTTTVTSTYTDAQGKAQTCTFKVTVQCNPNSPTITITRAPNNQLQLNWDTRQVLQSAQSITGPWNTVSNASPPFNVTPTGTSGYYRIVPAPR